MLSEVLYLKIYNGDYDSSIPLRGAIISMEKMDKMLGIG